MQPKARAIPIMSPADLDRACPPRERPVATEAPQTPTEALAVLNALALWGGRVRWVAFRRIGGLLIGITEDGEEVRYDVPKLVEFRHIQSRTLEYLGVALAPPKRGTYAVVAGTVGELMLHAAQQDVVDTGALEDDVKALIARCWEAAGRPTANENPELFQLLSKLRRYKRDPYAEAAPPCVIQLNEEVLVHPQVFQAWIGCPTGAARHLTLVQIREALGLLGLRAYEFDLEHEGERLRVTLWRGKVGPLNE